MPALLYRLQPIPRPAGWCRDDRCDLHRSLRARGAFRCIHAEEKTSTPKRAVPLACGVPQFQLPQRTPGQTRQARGAIFLPTFNLQRKGASYVVKVPMSGEYRVPHLPLHYERPTRMCNGRTRLT